MKYKAKHPDGVTYDLTIEEMQTPHLIRQLQISSFWKVLDEDKWVDFPVFLKSKGEDWNPALKESDEKTISTLMSARATWCPGSVFGLVIRFLGLYLTWQGLQGILSFIISSKVAFPMLEQVTRVSPLIILLLVVYIVGGLYLMLRPHALVSLVFSAR